MVAIDTEPRGANRPDQSRKKFDRRRLLTWLLIIGGILGLCYPVVATFLVNKEQAKVADAYRRSTSEMPKEDREAWLAKARKYNEDRAGGPILDPWLARVSKNNRPYQDYLEQLNPKRDNSPIASLAIPSIKSTLPVYHGTEMDVLTKGVGHLYGSALPVGGKGMHSVLTSHSGLVNATLFDNLEKVEIGDRFFIEVMGEKLAYKVDQIKVVLPNETQYLRPEDGRDLVTLITCTPYGVNSHRLLVRGHRVPLDPEEAEEAFDNGGIWQWWMLAVIAVLIALLVLWRWLVRRAKRKKGAAEAESADGESAEGDSTDDDSTERGSAEEAAEDAAEDSDPQNNAEDNTPDNPDNDPSEGERDA